MAKHLLKMDQCGASSEWERTAFWYENVNFSSSFSSLASISLLHLWIFYFRAFFFVLLYFYSLFKTQREIFWYRKYQWIDNEGENNLFQVGFFFWSKYFWVNNFSCLLLIKILPLHSSFHSLQFCTHSISF